jgi:3,4-dihydroxy 2-butanone 4-phosphate synthase / GTP cyclohydrolase II
MNSDNQIILDSVESALEDIKQGKVIIVVDDEDRENEGDFICAAQTITPEIINFMASHGRGLICTPLESDRARELGLNLMVQENTAMHSTAFTVSIDLLGFGCSTGISAYDRATGIKALTSSDIKAEDYARPGHIFPLIAKSGGVLVRTGHTEAAVDLARLAGLYPAGVLVEILNEDGTMARLPQLMDVSKKLGLKIISIKDLVAFRLKNEKLIEKSFETKIDTAYGAFSLTAFKQVNTGEIHIALHKGEIKEEEITMVRVHSNIEGNDVLSLLFDGYNGSVNLALSKIEAEGKGVFLFIKHSDNIDYLTLIQQKLNLVEKTRTASDEQRDFGIGAQILRALGVGKISLITNSPKRRVGLIGYGLEVVEVTTLN